MIERNYDQSLEEIRSLEDGEIKEFCTLFDTRLGLYITKEEMLERKPEDLVMLLESKNEEIYRSVRESIQPGLEEEFTYGEEVAEAIDESVSSEIEVIRDEIKDLEGKVKFVKVDLVPDKPDILGSTPEPVSASEIADMDMIGSYVKSNVNYLMSGALDRINQHSY